MLLTEALYAKKDIIKRDFVAKFSARKIPSTVLASIISPFLINCLALEKLTGIVSINSFSSGVNGA